MNIFLVFPFYLGSLLGGWGIAVAIVGFCGGVAILMIKIEKERRKALENAKPPKPIPRPECKCSK